MPYFVDCVETGNIDNVFDSMVELVKTDDNIVCVAPTLSHALVFSIETGDVYTITNAELTNGFFTAGDRVIIRGSVDTTGLIDNDGCYTIVSNTEGVVVVTEPVKAATSVLTTTAGGLGIDEYATFILHPTKDSGKMAIWLNAVANLAKFDASLVPGGYWAAKAEAGQPVYQGSGVTAKTYLMMVETAKYLQTDLDATLAIDAVAGNNIDKRNTMLLRIFPGTIGDPLLVDEINITYIMIA